MDDNLLREYTKKKIIDGFVQKPIGLHDFIKEVDTQLQAYEMQKKFPYQWLESYKTFTAKPLSNDADIFRHVALHFEHLVSGLVLIR